MQKQCDTGVIIEAGCWVHKGSFYSSILHRTEMCHIEIVNKFNAKNILQPTCIQLKAKEQQNKVQTQYQRQNFRFFKHK